MIAAERLPAALSRSLTIRRSTRLSPVGLRATGRCNEQHRDGTEDMPIDGVGQLHDYFLIAGGRGGFFHIENVRTQTQALHDCGQFIAIERAVHAVELRAGGQRAQEGQCGPASTESC